MAATLWDQEKVFTCKHATERDIVWLSPEAAALCRQVDVADVFAEHSTVTVSLAIPIKFLAQLVWPRPSPIPWASVDSSWTLSASPPSWTSLEDVDVRRADWASSFERGDGRSDGQGCQCPISVSEPSDR